jgi:hypothetical protein
MTEDIGRLMRRAGVAGDSYREVVLEQGAEQAGRLWPLIAAVDRRLMARGNGSRRTPEGER